MIGVACRKALEATDDDEEDEDFDPCENCQKVGACLDCKYAA